MLATSMHAQPGVYGVLLGSGVSTGAGVPTGWGVVKELVRRAATAATPEDPEALRLAQDDPEAWWDKHGDGELGYASLLESLAPLPAARQGLLADFFEPTDEEREEGIKVPSKAHHAVAQLVKRGLVRVILTTNFDRLMEQALEAAGVSPQVIARPEAVNGMAPLVHADATVVKLHGDYKDLGTRNTPEELSDYPAEWTTLLRQVFDEYGLLISGWSADWDTALVAALDATPNRRYPLYWDSRSSKGDTAQRILANRRGLVIQSAGADELFGDLLGSIEALDRLSQPPLTTAMAVARLKRYLPDPVRRIDLHDLIMDTANDLAASIAEQPVTETSLDGEKIQRIYERYLKAATPLTHLLVTGVWHDDGTNDRLWVDALQRLIDAGTAPISSATTGLDSARLWPALFAATAMGVAAVRRDRERLIIRLGTEPAGRTSMGTGEPMNASQLLHPNRLLADDWVNAMPRWNGGRWLYPASHVLKADIRRFFEDLIPLDADYRTAIHGYEYRLGLIQEQRQDGRGYRALSGEYVGENQWSWDERDVPLVELAFRAAADRSRDWPWADFLGGSSLDQVLIDHREVLKHYKRYG
ncbi:SIR2 family protein [Nocardioides abyssi]|uniref:SIR2 family protein n=1 Tax=Nocardioides abyssi TaxID=3058370 RepID=A0ABT8ESL0_9ACTN|nr:SIR2 family protein [Nocardioides abyssi]MDN4161079.1 SIR2 family protein [Nocardioides abyssi]